VTMQITSRFTIATHAMLCIAHFSGTHKVTSGFIAGSVNTNPVVIRRILGQLKEAGLIRVEAGVGGAFLEKAPGDITLLDIFNAVECVDGPLFHFHEAPNPKCPVGGSIHAVLDDTLADIQRTLEHKLAQTTLLDLEDSVLASEQAAQ
ncbi:MAG: Rrf2 family transcriptional regulator, partial [Hominenteromicrobium sp.]